MKKSVGTLLIAFCFSVGLKGHGGEPHQGSAVPSVEKEVRGNQATYRVILGYTPNPCTERQMVEFGMKAVRLLPVPDPLLGAWMPLEPTELSLFVRSAGRRNGSEDAGIELEATGEAGTFFFHTRFPSAGRHQVVLSIHEEEGNVLEVEFPVQAQENPYDLWALGVANGVFILAVLAGGPKRTFRRVLGHGTNPSLPGGLLFGTLLLLCVVAVSVAGAPRLSDLAFSAGSPPHGDVDLTFRDEKEIPSTVEVSPQLLRHLRIDTAAAENTVFGETLRAQGRFTVPPHAGAVVTAPLWGRIEYAGRPLQVGSSVKKGEPLVQVVLELSQVERKDMQDRFVEIRNAVLVAEQRLTAQRKELERVIEEVERKMLAPQAIEWARQRVEGAEQEVDILQKQLDQYEGVMKWRDPRSTPVVSPIDGVITAVHFTPGELNREDEVRKLFEIKDLSRLWLEVEIPEIEAGRLSSVSGCQVLPAAFPDLNLQGRLKAVVPVVDRALRTLKAIFEVPNPQNRFKAGMWADAVIETGRKRPGTYIPRSAVVSGPEGPEAYVPLSPGSFERRRLRLGLESGAKVEVVEGLEPGEKVAVTGLYELGALFWGSDISGGHGH